MRYHVYEITTSEGDAALVELRPGEEFGRVRWIWDDTRALAWENAEFGWVFAMPDEAVKVPAEMLRESGVRREDLEAGLETVAASGRRT